MVGGSDRAEGCDGSEGLVDPPVFVVACLSAGQSCDDLWSVLNSDVCAHPEFSWLILGSTPGGDVVLANVREKGAPAYGGESLAEWLSARLVPSGAASRVAAYTPGRAAAPPGGPDDEVIWPYESAFWGYFAEDSREVLVPRAQQPLYTGDYFGLRTAEAAGRLAFVNRSGMYHTDWLYNRPAFDAVTEPFLRAPGQPLEVGHWAPR